MPTKIKALELAVDFCKSFSHLQGYQDPKNVVDVACVFMAYLDQKVDNSALESADKKNYRNPSGKGNS